MDRGWRQPVTAAACASSLADAAAPPAPASGPPPSPQVALVALRLMKVRRNYRRDEEGRNEQDGWNEGKWNEGCCLYMLGC